MPLIASFGSVVGLPSAAIAQSAGIGLPAAAARRILPIAVALIAMSTSTGWVPLVGTAKAIGLFPVIASAPPGAGSKGRVFDITIPTQPWLAIRRA